MAKILLVDDRLVNREYLASLLSYFNHQLLEAENGIAALELAKKQLPDLIITDILMPTMDGYQLVEAIRSNAKTANIPVIFYTASYRANEARLLANKCGVQCVLPKPCEPQEMVATIDKILNSRREKLSSPAHHDVQLNYLPMHGIGRQELIKIGNDIEQSLTDIEKIKIFFNPSNLNNIVFEKNKLMKISQTLSTNLDKIRQISSKLFTLIEFNLDLILEHQPEKLLKLFCEGTKSLLNCELCVTGILTEKQDALRFWVTSGDDRLSEKQIQKINPNKGLIGQILREKTLVRINNIHSLASDLFPENHLPVHSIIGVPLLTPTNLYGFAYFVNKKDQPFDNEDARLAETLTAIISVLYENIDLYDLIQRHATKLQLEITERKNTEFDLIQSEQLFRQFAENTKDVFWRYDSQSKKFIYISPSYEEIWGRSIQEVYQNPKEWLNAVIPEHREFVRNNIRNLAEKLVGIVNIEFDIFLPNQDKKTIYTRMFPLKDEKNRVINVLGIATDVTEHLLIKLQETLYEGARQILENSANIQQAAPLLLQHLCSCLGYSVGELWLIDPKEQVMRCIYIWTVDEPELQKFASKNKSYLFKQGEGIPGQIWLNKKTFNQEDIETDNNLKNKFTPKQLKSAFGLPIFHKEEMLGALDFLGTNKQNINYKILDSLNVVGGLIGNFIKQRYNEEQLLSLINYDMLTGTANRATFEKYVETQIKEYPEKQFALIVLDLKKFNMVNETLGHTVGDAILQQVAERIRSLVKNPEAVTRIGSDKFAILFDAIADKNVIDDTVAEIFNNFSAPFYFSGHEKQISLHVGVSIYPQDGNDAASLLKNGDIALIKAKQQETKFAYFSAEMSAIMQEKLMIEKDLYRALENNEFLVYYQPIVEAVTHRIVTVECLLRWKHPSKGFIPPEKFITLAEETGLIISISKWLLNKVCKDIKNYQNHSSKDIKFSVNLSAQQFKDPFFLKFVQETICAHAINYSAFIFEITETLLISNLEKCKEILETLQSFGAKIALDDFGTVYSSLSYLKHFPIDYLKIDKSFSRKLPFDETDSSLVKAIITLGKSLNMKIIAEGVETKAQADFLAHAGCEEIQGFYYYKPMPFADLLKLFQM